MMTPERLKARLEKIRKEIDSAQGALNISDTNFEKLNYFLTHAINCLDDAIAWTEED